MKKIAFYIVALFGLLSLVACNTDDAAGEKKEDNAKQVEAATGDKSAVIEFTDAIGNTITFDAPPATIATLNPGELDILLKLGANVVGRSEMSGELSEEVASIPELGNVHNPSFEQIAAVNPDVLIVPPSFMQYASNIEGQGTKVIYSNADSIDEILDSVTMIGQLLQKEDEAAAINKTIEEKIASIHAKSGVRTLLVYGAPGTYLAALNNSLSGDILMKSGGENIAADFKAEDKYPQYASLSPELIMERDPEVIMLLTHSDPKAVKAGFEKQMSDSAAWSGLDAVKNDRVYILPAELFGNNPGTKIIDALDYMITTLDEVK